MKPSVKRYVVVALYCCFGWWCPSASAQATQPAAGPVTQPAAPPISHEAQALLDRVRDAYANIQSLELAGTWRLDHDIAGHRQSHHSAFTAAFAAPNRFRHELADDALVICDGAKAFLYVAASDRYTETPAPEARAASAGLQGQVLEVLRAQNPSLFLVLCEDASTELLDGARAVTRLQDVRLDQRQYAALQIETEKQDLRLLIDPSSDLIRQVRFDLAKALKARGAPDVKSAIITIDYTTVRPGATLADAQFTWAPPQGAMLARNELEPSTPAGPADPMALKGKPAPDFTLADLNDASVSLKSLRGSVVVLDFWATWCGPCRVALPHLDQLHRDFSDAGVKVFAVNLREEKDVAQKYVDSNKLSMPVLLDSTGSVAQKFSVRGIPQTVVIDKNGTITHVLVGFGPGSDAKLRQAVEQANTVR